MLVVILARANSKRLPGKNLRLLGGLPLIAHTVLAAKNAAGVHRVVVSTDGEDIASAARAYGAEVPFMRPSTLATDDASSEAALLHAVDYVADEEAQEPSCVVLLQPTSPLRSAKHVEGALSLLHASPLMGAVVSVTEPKPPEWIYLIDSAGWLSPLLPPHLQRPARSQSCVIPNGAIYAARIRYLREEGFFGSKTAGYVMAPEDSIDIDTAADFAIAQALFAARSAERNP